jgi:guanine deaminase
MLILSGQILIADETGGCRLEPGVVRIDGERIGEVTLGEIARSPDFGGPEALICPGFIDAHLHLPQFDMIGAHGMPLLRWLKEVTFPAEQKWADENFARSMSQRVIKECFRFGTTAICAYATSHHAAAMAALEEASSMGMRGVIGQVLMDRNAPEDLCPEIDRQIDELDQTLRQHPPKSRMSAAVTPRFAIACTQELLAKSGEIAQQYDSAVQTHLAETERECSLVKELFDGIGYVNVYEEANLLTKRTILGHGIHLDSADRQLLSASRAAIAHCPTANSFLRSGLMNRRSLVDSQVPMVLGSDIGAGYEKSMVRVARAMIETASAVGSHFPTAAEAWHQITAGNADSLGWNDAGRLKVDHPADVLVVHPTIPWLKSNVDPLSTLLFAWDDRWIQQTFVLGRNQLASDDLQ